MDLYIAFFIFIATMVVSLLAHVTTVISLFVGWIAFMIVAMRRGYSFKRLLKMCYDSNRASAIVLLVMSVIGLITATWRVSGTISIFVYYGMKIIQPSLFLIITFLLSALLSYAIGTSFGVAGTVGVIFMTIARSGGANPIITAGVIMSGVYFGDRSSPVSSSANMIAGITKTNIYDNVKLMMKTGLIPLIVTIAIYTALSFMFPLTVADNSLISTFEKEFNLSVWSFVPAVLMLVLPIFKVNVLYAMIASIISGIAVSVFVQGVPVLTVLKTCIFGFKAETDGLASILNGGGLLSMLEIIGVLLLSCSFSGIFNGTHMLDNLQSFIMKRCEKRGRFHVMLSISTLMSAIFCNQTIATLMVNDLMRKPYLDSGATNTELMIDMENSVILISCLLPWCLGCSFLLGFLGVDFRAMAFAVYMYLLPLIYLLTKRKWFPIK